MNFRRLKLIALIVLAASSTLANASPEAAFTPKQLREDLAAIETVLWRKHPDVSHSASPKSLKAAIRKASQALDRPMTQTAAWTVFAKLNPVFADAHLLIGFADRRGEVSAHLAAGGLLFPYEIEIDEDGKPFIKALAGGAPTDLEGARILSINGEPAAATTRLMLDLTPGETLGFRRGNASRRFAYYHLKLRGASAEYNIELKQDGRRRSITVPGSTSVPANMAEESQFDRTFKFELLPCGGALLTINSFVWPEKQQFLDFTREAFAQIKSAGATSLIIDVRANTGGNDDMWQEGIMPYIATSRYQWASSFKKRVLNPDLAKGEKAGDVVSGLLETWREPDLENPLRFNGRTYVLIGQETYSSSILFTNVMRDFGFAEIAGVGGFARADQSGGTQTAVLPQTGLVMVWPRFILTRPSGKTAPEFVEPDIMIKDDPYNSRAAVAALTQCLAVESARR